jgi:hypothetical protein
MFLLPASCNKFVGTPTEVKFDGCIMRAANRGHTQKQVTMENIYESTTQQRRSHQWVQRLNCYLQMVHTVSTYMARFSLVSPLCQNKANKKGHGQLCIFDSAETTMKWLQEQSNEMCMAVVMQ